MYRLRFTKIYLPVVKTSISKIVYIQFYLRKQRFSIQKRVQRTQTLMQIHSIMYLSSASPKGGGPRADVGEYGDFMGTLQQISALVVVEMWGLRFLNALLSGRMWGFRFCSTERRLGTIDCSLD